MDWPAAYLQPDKKESCGEHSVAYICRALGHPEATAEAVYTFCAEKRLNRLHYPDQFDIERDSWYQHFDDKQWWLGPSAREWVAAQLRAGWIGAAIVWRTTEMAHAVVLLEDRGDDGVLLMDPGRGLIVEPWAWFLSLGPGTP